VVRNVEKGLKIGQMLVKNGQKWVKIGEKIWSKICLKIIKNNQFWSILV
jgi:hypothetical protein